MGKIDSSIITLYYIGRKIMENIILEFLEAYKSLDELCKQILSSDRGISTYIDEMEQESQGYAKVNCWEKDYKRLKKMRWIRNQLVHETNSFHDNLINIEDVEWLKIFRSRIMECTDPFSLLYKSINTKRKTANQEKHPENYFKTKEASNEPFSDKNLVIRVGMLIGTIILIIIIIIWLENSNL